MINDLSGLVSAAGLSQDGGVLVRIVGWDCGVGILLGSIIFVIVVVCLSNTSYVTGSGTWTDNSRRPAAVSSFHSTYS